MKVRTANAIAEALFSLWALFILFGLFFFLVATPALFALGLGIMSLPTWGGLAFAFIAAFIISRIIGEAASN